MITSEPAGVVAELWQFPVKSMGGGSLEEAILTGQGVLGDRGFALLDVETDEVVSASNTKHFPGLLDCRAAFLEPPQATFFARLDLECTAPTESFVDLCPVSVITTATLAELSLAYQGSTFDPRRFRMNVVVATKPGGFVENAWAGRRLALGWQVRLAVTMPDPRCVITTLAQGDLDKDPDILRTVAQRNSLPVGRGGPLPCAGVYAAVEHPGLIRRGDPVFLTDR